MSIPAEITIGLDHYQVATPLRALIEHVSTIRSLTADPPGVGYVAVRPSAWGNVSAYFHTTYVDIALTPDKARWVEQTQSWPVIKINSETGFIRVKANQLADAETQDLAASLLTQAVDKSEVGTAYEGGAASKHNNIAQAVCPTCQMEMPATGVCDDCG